MERDAVGDQEAVVAGIREVASTVAASLDRAWSREPAVRVIDCVLSLNRNYKQFVVPRLDGFEEHYPDVRSVPELRMLIESFPSAHAFVQGALNYNHVQRAVVLSQVANWLTTIGEGSVHELELWAGRAQPSDYLMLGFSGFGLAGFQYLRMLFGANTTKPDIHICRTVENWVGRPVPPIRALQLLESAAEMTGIRLRDLDTTIWENSVRRAK